MAAVGFRRRWAWVLVAYGAILAADPLCVYLTLGPVDGRTIGLLEAALAFALLGVSMTAAVSPILLLSHATRRAGLLAFAVSFTLALTLYGSLRLGNVLWHQMLVHVTERSEPLVAAIHSYVKDHGAPPKDLASLVPHYIASIPGTGMGAYPRYKYFVGKERSSDERHPWLLTIEMFEPFQWDELMYFPDQEYPDSGYGGGFERIGKWGYLHE